MFGGNNRSNRKKKKSRRRSSQDEPSYDEYDAFDQMNGGDGFGRNTHPRQQPYQNNGYDNQPPQQNGYAPHPQQPQRDSSYHNGNHQPPQMDGLEPTMLPESRTDRQQRAANRFDGTSRDRAIRELPPNMPDFGDAPPPPQPQRQLQARPNGRSAPPPPQARADRANGRSNGRSNGHANYPTPPNGYDEVVGAPARPPEPTYDEVIGQAPPPARPAQRPERPQVQMRRPDERQRSIFNGENNAPTPRQQPPQQRQQRPPAAPPRTPQRPAQQPMRASSQLSEPVRFDRGGATPSEGGYGDNGYASFETVKKGRKKGKRRKRKEQVQMPDQKMDVGESIDLRDGTSRLLMRFDAGIVDNLRHMTTKLSTATGQIPSRIALVSSLPGEGVTYVSRALATVMAHDMSARVAYVDLNWWSNGEPAFAHPDNQGLVSVVTGEKRLDEIFVSTTIPNLTLVPGGQLERGDRPIMARSNVLHSAIDVLDQHFDYLIFDVPAIRATNDAVPLAKLAKGVVLVVKQGETPNETVRQAIDEIQHLNLLGIMLNQVKYKTPEFIRRVIPQD